MEFERERIEGVVRVLRETRPGAKIQGLEADVAQVALRLGPDEHYRLMPDRAWLSIRGSGKGGE